MKKRNTHQTEYWQSYSDMMAALLLIFILIIAVAFIQVQKKEKEYSVFRDIFIFIKIQLMSSYLLQVSG